MGPLHRFLNPLVRLLAWGLLTAWLGLGVALATPVGPAPSGPASTVEVQDGDMASVLAFRLKPRGATIEQMMVALLARNPDAFILGNVNLLKQGAVLRLPPAEDVLRLPPEQARDMVQRHYQASVGDLQAPSGPTLSALATPAAALSAASTALSPSAAPTEATADPAAEREALLDRLRLAKARLNELQQNIQELERLTQAPGQTLPQASDAQAIALSERQTANPDWPTAWVWLGVAAIVAIMVGVGYSRAQRRPETPATTAPAGAAADFQARLNSLDLDLDTPPSPPPLSGRAP